MEHGARDQVPEWERYRGYLGLLARQAQGRLPPAKLDLSGVVQQTLLEAARAWGELRAHNEAQKAAWLRKVLAHNLADEVRKLGAGKRDRARERSLDAAVEESSARLGACLAAAQSSPSQRAVRHEELLRLADALAALPEDQRRAVELHHLNGLPLAEVARQLGRSKPAVAGLLHRGLDRLRTLLQDESLS
jgi:RNA polymerase sigma-70 factor (ECF subfamily)